MMRALLGRIAILGAAGALVGACASGRVVTRHVLSPPARDNTAQVADPARSRVQVDRVRVPDFLDTTDIVVRRGSGELVASRSARWGERLSAGIRDALIMQLRNRPSGALLADADVRDPEALHLAVTIEAFDVFADGRVLLVASWTWSGGQFRAPQAVNEQTFSLPAMVARPPADDAGLVAAMTAAIAALAECIAAGYDTANSMALDVRPRHQ